jgi:hypothetical protein
VNEGATKTPGAEENVPAVQSATFCFENHEQVKDELIQKITANPEKGTK